jgi:protein-disulfide isomerase
MNSRYPTKFRFGTFACLLIVFGSFSTFAWAEESGACVRGKSSAPIKLEVFSDFQCPSCRAFYLQTMQDVFKEYADTGKVCVVYRSFPLQIHAYAADAARYGEAALRVGAMQWKLVADALFSNQDQWGESGDVEAVVSKALTKADMDALRKQLQNPTPLNAAIYEDIKLGLAKEVRSTPTFFITAQGKTQAFAAALTYAAVKRYLDGLPAK